MHFPLRNVPECLALGLALTLTNLIAPRVEAQTPALSADPEAPGAFILNTGRTGGWRFTVNGPIQVTHLGLFDRHADGFQQSYPIGIWNQAGTLLTSATMPSGIGGAYLDGFRYVAVGGGPILAPGETYTIGYFALDLAFNDTMISDLGFHSVDPMINQSSPGVSSNGIFPGLTMPTVGFTETWVGPSFQYMVVPTPAAWLVIAGFASVRNRRR